MELALPLDCQPGENCWIPRYVDHDPSPGVRDYACGELTGDDHSGTDFAIPHLAAMRQGVPVLAAAGGTVRGVRDGMADVNVETVDRAEIAGQECGNGVLIEHEDGWQTQYCHLREGSVQVETGDRVEAGTQLGLVGLSGDTSFAHVHLSVRRDGDEIDPFLGLDGGQASQCGRDATPLWQPELADRLRYQEIVLRNVGFSDYALDWSDVENGALERPPSSVGISALVFAFDGFHLREGDVIEVRIDGPGGWRHEHNETVERARASFFRFTGRKAPETGFAQGTYEARLTVWRQDRGLIAEINRDLILR